MLRINEWMAVALLCAASAHAADTFEKTFSRTLPFSGGRVSIDHSFGRVEVRTTSGDDVTVRASIRASDAELGKQIQVIASKEPGGISVRTLYPEVHWHGGSISYSADLEVTIPERAPLFLKNRFGSTEVAGLHAASEIINAHGSLTVRDVRGNQRIENSFASINVENAGGDTTVQDANGSVHVQNVQGNLTVINRFGSVHVSRAGRDVSINNSNASVEVNDVGGTARITNSFATVRVGKVDGNLEVTNQNARVEANDVKGTATINSSFATVELRNSGPARIKNANGSVMAADIRGTLNIDTRFGMVRAERIRGALDVDNANGSVTASDIGGSARVHTGFASVFLKGVNGAVDVENQNGAISVSGLRGSCDPVVLKTTFSSIRVALPPNANYNIDARTRFGSINVDLPINLTRKTEDSFAGTIGGGGCRMDLTTANGSITITRE